MNSSLHSRHACRIAARILSAAGSLALLASSSAQDFFTYDPAAVGNGFVQAPLLDNSNASEVAYILITNLEAAHPRAVGVGEALESVDSRAVVTYFPLDRLFGDYTGADRAALTA